MRKKNGFTLVELLAVIVILAIIMIIAIPSVLDTMSNMRRKTFVEYANKVYSNTVQKYQLDQQDKIPGAGVFIYNIKNLGSADTGDFKGFVIIDAENVDDPQFVIYLWDNYYMLYNYNVQASGGLPDDSNTTVIQTYNEATVSQFNSEPIACVSYLGDSRVAAGGYCIDNNGFKITLKE